MGDLARRFLRLSRHLAVPAAAAQPVLVGSGHLHRVRQAGRQRARAGRGCQDRGFQPARRPLPAHRHGDRPALPRLPLAGDAGGRAGAAGRAFRFPGQPGCAGEVRGLRAFWGRPEPGHRGRVRVLLGPAADGQLRFPRDRLRRPAAGLFPVRAGPRPHQGRGLVGAPAGLRQGGSGLHGSRHRPLPGHRRHASRGSRRQAAHQGGPGPRDLGFCLVVPGHRGDHPALQPGPPVRLLERRRDPRPRRAPDRDRPDRAVLPRVARQAANDRDAAAADRVHRARLAAGPDRRAESAVAFRVHELELLGNVLALQRHGDADHLHRGHRRDGQDRRRHGRGRPGRIRELGQREPGRAPRGPSRSAAIRRRHDAGDHGPAGLPVPAQHPVERAELPDQQPREGRRRGHGQSARWRHRAGHPGSARAARRPHRHLLDRQQRQPQDPVHRVRRPEQRLHPGDQQRPRLHRPASTQATSTLRSSSPATSTSSAAPDPPKP